MRTLLLAAACCLALPACATATRGTSQNWAVITSPAGARMIGSNGLNCASTPCSFTIPRQSRFTATITHPGHQTVVAQIDHRFSNGGAGSTAGNLILGGVIGLGVDAMSGANQDVRPNPLQVTLEPGEGTITLDWAAAERVSLSGGDLSQRNAPPPAQPEPRRQR